MTKETHHRPALVCGADSCYDVPVIGSAYCMRHAAEASAAARSARAIWIWVAVAAAVIPAVWLLLNSDILFATS
jgi:hypothetical protein